MLLLLYNYMFFDDFYTISHMKCHVTERKIMQKKLYTDFNKRQYMQAPDYEIFYYNDKNLDHVSPHSHDYYEFYFFMEGDVTYMVDGNTYPFAPGDYLLIPPGLPHYPLLPSLASGNH